MVEKQGLISSRIPRYDSLTAVHAGDNVVALLVHGCCTLEDIRYETKFCHIGKGMREPPLHAERQISIAKSGNMLRNQNIDMWR